MPKGQPLVVPDDGLTTHQRRNRPLLMVHTGDGKGKSTAAFGLALRAWNQGWDIGVFQFVKSAKWRIGEQTVLERLDRVSARVDHGTERLDTALTATARGAELAMGAVGGNVRRTAALLSALASGGRVALAAWRAGVRRGQGRSLNAVPARIDPVLTRTPVVTQTEETHHASI